MDPISAATHFAPYDFYYARLRARGGLTYDSALGLWVASSAAAVAAVLNHPACRVRPPQEPVPRAIAGRPAGDVFARLMRMNDGLRHGCPRAAMAAPLQQLGAIDLQPWLAQWRPALSAPQGANDLQRWQWRLPVALLAGLLGIAAERREDLARRTGEFVACLSPLSNAEQLQAADSAAQHLIQQMQALLDAPQHSPFLRAILERSQGLAPEDLQANLLGLLAEPSLCQRLSQDPDRLSAWLLQRQRLDPPVQNTRRFVATACTLLGVDLQAGETVLVLLAAANHDPALAAVTGCDPAYQGFSFGSGTHRCPGQGLALNIVQSLLQQLLSSPGLSTLTLDWNYLPSVNGRLPLFTDAAG